MEVIIMREPYHRKKFTDEELELLRANPFTSRVDYHHIWFTLEFQNLFLSRYEAGESSPEIFSSLGYDIDIIGYQRVCNYPRQLRHRLESGKELTESHGNAKAFEPTYVDYNTMPSQQAVASMQRELTYLRQQVEFLKKITRLDKEQK